MYSLRIEAQQRRAAEIDMGARHETSKAPAKHSDGAAEEPEELLGAELPEGADSVEFSVGNPRVEHITGVVHLYREVQQGPGTAAGASRPEQQASEVSHTSVPAADGAPATGQVQGGTPVPVELAPNGRPLPVGASLRLLGMLLHVC
jgi:hypothetical protein